MSLPFHILCVPAFQDNYLWLIHNGKQACAVDPGDANVITAALHEQGLQLSAILLTHHHADHTGGVAALLQTQGALPVYGPARENIAHVTQALSEGQQVHLFSDNAQAHGDVGLTFTVMDVPGHTRGHIAYFTQNFNHPPVLFCGDTLFACGCGRLFEGTSEQMWHSLSRLAALPAHTLIYCAHEYTLSNMAFAQVVEPHNQALQKRHQQAKSARACNLATVPFTLAEELACNPFLRAGESTVMESARQKSGRPIHQALDSFAVLREWKNNF